MTEGGHTVGSVSTATWRKSSATTGENCVELLIRSEMVIIRDSKDPTGPHLTFDITAWNDARDTMPDLTIT